MGTFREVGSEKCFGNPPGRGSEINNPRSRESSFQAYGWGSEFSFHINVSASRWAAKPPPPQLTFIFSFYSFRIEYSYKILNFHLIKRG